MKDGGPASLIRGNALTIPLADESVDLIVTSPPYFALRSYTDTCGTCGGGPPLPPLPDMSASTLASAYLKGRGSVPKEVQPQIPDPDCIECAGSGRGHYAGQLGSEPTPAEFIAALVKVTGECVRVLKPSGSLWVNLGDKYAGGGGYSPDSPVNVARREAGTGTDGRFEFKPRTSDPARARGGTGKVPSGMRAKSLMGLPWRYAIGCIDQLGLILRAEIIWSKPNGLPESVQDRVRRSHEQWFMFTKEPRYYSAVDEIREPFSAPVHAPGNGKWPSERNDGPRMGMTWGNAELGKLPGSVWTIPTEPLRVPDHLPQHFAAFPSEWPRRIILGWSPSGVCTECGEGRRPVVGVETGETEMKRVLTPGQRRGWVDAFKSWCSEAGVAGRDLDAATGTQMSDRWLTAGGQPEVPTPAQWGLIKDAIPGVPIQFDDDVYSLAEVPKRARRPRDIGGGKEQYSFNQNHNPTTSTITGESCACPQPDAPTRPAVILDPFVGTGTSVAVANALGRHGIGIDLSADYLRLAKWRCADPGLRAKVLGLDKPPVEVPGQMMLL